MWPDRVSNPGPPTYESGALSIALRGPATTMYVCMYVLAVLKRNVAHISFKSVEIHILKGA